MAVVAEAVAEDVAIGFEGVCEGVFGVKDVDCIEGGIADEVEGLSFQREEVLPVDWKVSGKDDAAPLLKREGTEGSGINDGCVCGGEAEDEAADEALKGAALAEREGVLKGGGPF